MAAELFDDCRHGTHRGREIDLFDARFPMDTQTQLSFACSDPVLLTRAGDRARIETHPDGRDFANHVLGTLSHGSKVGALFCHGPRDLVHE